jgi:hypothetical protein
MKLNIEVEYFSGEAAIYVAASPEWSKWESKTGKTIQQAESIGVNDLLFLGYNAMKREAAGTPIKPYEVWIETVAEVKASSANPKAIPLEA